MTRSLVQKCSVPDDLKTTIHAHIEHLRTHGRYELFEGVYVTLSERYYEKEGNEVFEVVGMDSAKYFEYVVERMKQERERSGVLLEQESTGKVLGCVEQALVVKRAVWVATGTYRPSSPAPAPTVSHREPSSAQAHRDQQTRPTQTPQRTLLPPRPRTPRHPPPRLP